MTTDIQTLGRPPIINFVVSTDYGDSMSIGGTAGEGTSSLTLHLEVPLTPDEARDVRSALAKRRHDEARVIVETAMGRLVDPGNPKGRNCRALVKAAFTP